MSHELVRLSNQIDWSVFDEQFSQLYHADRGCPENPIRLMVGLLYLKHVYVYTLPNEQLVNLWQENLYWQYFLR